MKLRYLEVTFRKGKPLAAYLHLPRATPAKAARTTDAGHGVRIDYDAEDSVIGVEITAPSAVTITQLNAILLGIGIKPLTNEEWRPLAA
jgi:uncharacterized protein YuzE